MFKYDPLGGHLRRQHQDEVELTFVEIERVIGAMLPKRSAQPQWWSNEASPGNAREHRKAWREAGEARLFAGKDRV